MHPDKLRAAFDAFEVRLRGTEIWPHRVVLEPPFVPMLAEARLRGEPLDDSRRPRFWERKSSPPLARLAELPSTKPETRPDGPRSVSELVLLAPSEFVARGEPVLRLLASLRSVADRLSFEVVGTATETRVQLTCSSESEGSVRNAIQAYFPEVRIRVNPSGLVEGWEAAGDHCASIHLALGGRAYGMLRGESRFDTDPLIEIAASLSSIKPGEMGVVQLLFEPARHAWDDEFTGFLRAVDDAGEASKLVDQKFNDPSFFVAARTFAAAETSERSFAIARDLAAALQTATSSERNAITPVAGGATSVELEVEDVLDRESRRPGMLLSLSELATLVHVPSASVRDIRLARPRGRTKAAPSTAVGHSLILGINDHEGDSVVVSVSTEERLRHTYVVGASGTGKSTLLLSMAAQDIAMGNGFAVLDPHGDLVEDILARIPEERASDVLLFDAADEAYPIGFNVLSAHSELERTLLASDLVSVFKRLSTTFGDVMVSVLGNAALAFLESTEGGTLLDLRDFLVDPAFRAKVLKTVQDDEVVSYWMREFALLKGVPHAPVLTRLNAFLRPKLVRRMVAQKNDRLNLRRLMDSKTIILAKLSQGAIGEENAHLLGSLLVSKIAQAAMSRQNVDAAQREPYFLYIDEFHHFVTPSITTILSGARKYGLGLILAHQESRQLKSRSEDVASAVLANASTRVVYRVGEHDAKAYADGFAFFEPRDLQSRGVGEAIARIDRADCDFNLRTEPLESVEPRLAVERRSKILETSRAKFGTPAAEIDSLLASRREVAPDSAGEKPSPKRRGKAQSEAGAEAPLPGRGGVQHKYLQSLVKKLAEDRGFGVELEKRVFDGHGHIDAVLERGALRIAVEISVTTDVEHEVQNLTKCVAAGFEYVALISAERAILEAARAAFIGPPLRTLRFLLPESIIPFLDEVGQASPPRARMKAPPSAERASQLQSQASSVRLIAKDAASYIGLAQQTLAKMRWSGESPPYFKVGRQVVYDRADLDAWLLKRRRRSTSDTGPETLRP